MARKQQRHKLPRDVDCEQLRDRLSVRLSRPVEVIVTPPGEDGTGELIVCCRDTDEWLKVDPTVVQATVGLTPGVVTPLSSEQRLLADMTGSVGVDEQLAAVREFLQRTVDSDLQVRATAAKLNVESGLGVTVDLANREVVADAPLQPSDLHARHVSAFGYRAQRGPRQRPT